VIPLISSPRRHRRRTEKAGPIDPRDGPTARSRRVSSAPLDNGIQQERTPCPLASQVPKRGIAKGGSTYSEMFTIDKDGLLPTTRTGLEVGLTEREAKKKARGEGNFARGG